jgi:dTDP-glucose 4,6-dehydratase
MKLLITGGAGFIGSNYVYTHLEHKPQDELVVLDALTYSGHKEHLTEALEQGVRFVEGRIENRELVRQLFEQEKFDAVVHFAAETHVDRSIKDPALFIRSNVEGTQVLLDAARDFGVARFHQISTDEVYGDLGFGSTEHFTENSPIRPSNPYSASKAAADLLCLAYKRTYGLAVTVSRCSNNYGPFQSRENLIPLMIERALKGEELPVYGTGENIRDWLFVRDHCEAILAILERGRLGEVYNIGADNDQSNLNVVKMILKMTDKPESLIRFVEDRKGHDERYSMGYDKLKTELGWTPKVSFEQGMRATLDWYKLNPYERSYSRWRNRV